MGSGHVQLVGARGTPARPAQPSLHPSSAVRRGLSRRPGGCVSHALRGGSGIQSSGHPPPRRSRWHVHRVGMPQGFRRSRDAAASLARAGRRERRPLPARPCGRPTSGAAHYQRRAHVPRCGGAVDRRRAVARGVRSVRADRVAHRVGGRGCQMGRGHEPLAHGSHQRSASVRCAAEPVSCSGRLVGRRRRGDGQHRGRPGHVRAAPARSIGSAGRGCRSFHRRTAPMPIRSRRGHRPAGGGGGRSARPHPANGAGW
mgnify:CR=1 FL=1